jgi:hypothetical protein
MFSFFKKSGPRPQETQGPDSLPPRRMDLAERKAYRRELLYQSVKEAMLSLEVISSMYKFKVMNVDVRHHRFVVMIDVTQSFKIRKNNRPLTFYDLEELIKKSSFERSGIVVEGIYWRVNNTEKPFQPRKLPDSAPLASARKETRNKKIDISDEVQITQPLTFPNAFQSISEAEHAAFMDAIKRGTTLPVLHVGDKDYQSDLTPLDGGDRIGGTQYGRLE